MSVKFDEPVDTGREWKYQLPNFSTVLQELVTWKNM